MQFTVKVEPTLDNIIKKRGRKLFNSTKKALSITAQKGVEIILDRTEKGIGIKGKFEPYSEKYAIQKSKKDKSGICLLYTSPSPRDRG